MGNNDPVPHTPPPTSEDQTKNAAPNNENTPKRNRSDDDMVPITEGGQNAG